MTTLELSWTLSAHARRLVTVAVVATAVAVVTGHAGFLALAAPALLVLVSTNTRSRPECVRVIATVNPDRCIEGDLISLTVVVEIDQLLGVVDMAIEARESLRLESVARGPTAVFIKRVSRNWQLRAARWGRWTPATLTMVVHDRSRLWQATARCPVGDVAVFPHPASMNRLLVPGRLPSRIGTHTDRSIGSGVEFASIRSYVPGDALRDIDWPASLRHDELLVIERLAERSADVVVAVDAFTDVKGSLERSVRGCAGVAGAYLRGGDRVGLVVLGGSLTWLRPDTGDRTFYRITEAVMNVRLNESVVTPDLGRVPRTALPSTALVVLFSPLTDERSMSTLEDLHRRGTSLLVVDVLTAEPLLPRRRSRTDDVALRLWRLDRFAQRHRLGELGISVVRWDGLHGLDEVFAPLHSLTFTGVRR